MNILETNSTNPIEHKQNIEDFTKQILNRISYICLRDKHFHSYNLKLKKINEKVSELEKKLSDKEKLLKEVSELKLKVVTDSERIEGENQRLREKLLLLLGSEL